MFIILFHILYEYIIYIYLLTFEIFLINNKKGTIRKSDVDNQKPILLGGCDFMMISEVASLLF